MEKKDYFSDHSKIYAAFRPVYPDALYHFIFKHLKNKSVAWDCATGNGQVAQYLCAHFETVYATDISQQQHDNAFRAKNIIYSVGSAEKSGFADNQFDLITAGQALHWFKTDEFYAEVNRTARPSALVAVWGYALLTIDPTIDELFLDFYKNTTGPYWDSARKLVENEYRDVPFPFQQIESPRLSIEVDWTLAQFGGYLTSWSATQKYIRMHGTNPVDAFIHNLRLRWNEDQTKRVSFPLFLKLGRVGR
jgi:hypothetical protein